MADSNIPASMNGVPMDDDEFERNLQEIMDDGPTLSDSSSTVQSGSPQKPAMSQSAHNLSDGGGSQPPAMSQSLNLPPGQSVCLHFLFALNCRDKSC